MPGADEGFDPGRRLLDLANAVREDPDVTRGTLADLLAAHGESERDLTPESFTEEDADAVRSALGALVRTVLTETDPDRAAACLNTLLATYAGPPRLSRHGGHPWHLHVDRGDDAPWAEWLIAAGAHELARLLSTRGGVAWGECAAQKCRVLYLSGGPGSQRRYCSARCASRARVAAHRRRRAGEGEKSGG